MSEIKAFFRDLDDAVLHGTAEGRLRAMWYTTDLLIAGRGDDYQAWTFGKVIGRLADEIEIEARAQLATRIAAVAHAPLNLIHQLAADDSITVAGPVLRDSERIRTENLVAAASTQSQSHLLAISERRSIDPAVTDVLVTRGDREVVNSVGRNIGAQFSDYGFSHLLKRAEADAALAENLGLRPDLPGPLFQQLIAKASDDVKARLILERPELVTQIKTAVGDIAGQLQSRLKAASANYLAAKRALTEQHQRGRLNQKSIAGYAQLRKLDEVTVGLSLLCGLPDEAIDRILLDDDRGMLLTLARALDFSWESTIPLLFLGARDHRITTLSLNGMKNDFERLSVTKSRDMLKSGVAA